MFNHPHAEVVQRWQANGATVLTTGECGTITITTNGKALFLNTFIEAADLRR
jgi:beta-lactamase superfamily II metal-dependent hydrolase